MADKGRVEVPGSAHRSATVEFKIPDTMPVLISDIFVSQNSIEKGLFYLSFFQSRPPIFTDERPAPEKVPADCIVRLALTPQVMFALVQALQKSFGHFQETIQNEIAKAETQSKKTRGNHKR